MQVEYSAPELGAPFNPHDVRSVTLIDGFNPPSDTTVC